MGVFGEARWPEFPHLTPARIDEARRRLDVPEDWVAELCANRCGDVVFVPPDVPSTMLPTCSLDCALSIARNRS